MKKRGALGVKQREQCIEGNSNVSKRERQDSGGVTQGHLSNGGHGVFRGGKRT